MVAATKLGYRTDVESGAPNPEPILSVLKVLLSAGANIDARDRFGATALMMAVMNNHPTWCRLLIDEGAYVNAKNNDGKTAIDIAREQGHSALARYLDAESKWRRRGAFVMVLSSIQGAPTKSNTMKVFQCYDLGREITTYL